MYFYSSKRLHRNEDLVCQLDGLVPLGYRHIGELSNSSQFVICSAATAGPLLGDFVQPHWPLLGSGGVWWEEIQSDLVFSEAQTYMAGLLFCKQKQGQTRQSAPSMGGSYNQELHAAPVLRVCPF